LHMRLRHLLVQLGLRRRRYQANSPRPAT
jgi:hypothetical protein